MSDGLCFKKNIAAILFTFFFLISSFAVDSGYSIGNQPPDFKLKTVGGNNTVNLGQFRGKPIVLVYWATWCGPCRKEIPALKELYAKYSPKGVQFVSVAIGYRQTEDDVAKFAAAQQLPYTILWDKDNKVSEEWSVRSIPTNFVIDLDGVIRYRSYGISPEVDTLLQSMTKADN